MVKLKRIYENPNKDDGYRILVDRLWPRGIKKESARVDLWLKEVAPSNELRKWFGHDEDKFAEFRKRYYQELTNKEVVKKMKEILREQKNVTLLYAAKDKNHNQAVVLKEYLEK